MTDCRRVLACLAVLALCASSCGVAEPSESGREPASEATVVTAAPAREPEDVRPSREAAVVDASHAELVAVPGEATVIPDHGRAFVSWPAAEALPGSPVAGYEVQWKARGEAWDAARRAVVIAQSYELYGLRDGTHYVRVRPTVVERAEAAGAWIVSAQGTAPRAEIVAPPAGFDEASSISAFDGVVNFEMAGEPVWPATIEIPVDLTKIDDDDFIFLMSFNEEYGLWLPEPGAVFDPEAGVVTAEVYHLSPWDTFKRKVKIGLNKGKDIVREVRDDAREKAKIVREVVVKPVVNAGRQSIRFVYDKTKDVVYWTEKGIMYSMKAFQMSAEIALETARQYWETIKLTAAVPDIKNLVTSWYERNIDFDRPACADAEPEWVESVEKPAADYPMVVCTEAAASSGDLRLKVASQRYYPMILTARVSGNRADISPDVADGIRVELTEGASDLSEVLVSWLIEISDDGRYVVPVSATHWLRIPESLGENNVISLKGEYMGLAHILDTLLLAVDLLLTVSGKPVGSSDVDLLRALGDDIADCLSSDLLMDLGDEEQLWRTFSKALSCVRAPIQQARAQKGLGLLLGPFAIVLWFLEGVTQLSGYIQQGVDIATGKANPTVTINPVTITEHTETQPATHDTTPTPTEQATSTVEHNYQAITTGGGHWCAITTAGDAFCWGNNNQGESDPPAGKYQTITAYDDQNSCAITTAGDAVCWGRSDWGETDPPAGKYQAITAGGELSCAITTAGDAVCWGYNSWEDDLSWEENGLPAGKYQAITAGWDHSCAITTAGDAVCWIPDGSLEDPPAGKYQAITGGPGRRWCAITTAGDAVCWGHNSFEDDPPAGKYQAITIGERHWCAITTAGDAVCWGDNDYGQTDPPAGKYQAITAARNHSCAITTAGDIVCWGDKPWSECPNSDWEVCPAPGVVNWR